MPYCIEDQFLLNQFQEGVMSRPNTCKTVAQHEEWGNLLKETEADGWNLGFMIHVMSCPTCREKMQKANAITALRKSMVKWIDPNFDWCSKQSTK